MKSKATVSLSRWQMFCIAIVSTAVFLSAILPLLWGIREEATTANFVATLVATILSLVTGIFLVKKFEKYMNSQVDKYRRIHIKEFFKSLEEDEKIRETVMKKSIDLTDHSGKVIGTGTVYSVLCRHKDEYVNN